MVEAPEAPRRKGGSSTVRAIRDGLGAIRRCAVRGAETGGGPTVVNVDDPLAGHPLAACGADEAKQKENQNDFCTNCAWSGHLNGDG